MPGRLMDRQRLLWDEPGSYYNGSQFRDAYRRSCRWLDDGYVSAKACFFFRGDDNDSWNRTILFLYLSHEGKNYLKLNSIYNEISKLNT